MNTITTLDLSEFFHDAKREKFLREYHQALLNYKWFSGYGKYLTAEQEQERKNRSIRAIELANKIRQNRIYRMTTAGVFEEADRFVNTFRIY